MKSTLSGRLPLASTAAKWAAVFVAVPLFITALRAQDQTVNGNITVTGGTVTGGSAGLALNAGGSGQNVTIVPSGGNVSIPSGRLFIGTNSSHTSFTQLNLPSGGGISFGTTYLEESGTSTLATDGSLQMQTPRDRPALTIYHMGVDQTSSDVRQQSAVSVTTQSYNTGSGYVPFTGAVFDLYEGSSPDWTKGYFVRGREALPGGLGPPTFTETFNVRADGLLYAASGIVTGTAAFNNYTYFNSYPLQLSPMVGLGTSGDYLEASPSYNVTTLAARTNLKLVFNDYNPNNVASSFQLSSGNNTPVFTVLSNGMVGIGTTAPAVALHVVGDAIITATASIGTDLSVSGNTQTNTLTVFNGINLNSGTLSAPTISANSLTASTINGSTVTGTTFASSGQVSGTNFVSSNGWISSPNDIAIYGTGSNNNITLTPTGSGVITANGTFRAAGPTSIDNSLQIGFPAYSWGTLDMRGPFRSEDGSILLTPYGVSAWEGLGVYSTTNPGFYAQSATGHARVELLAGRDVSNGTQYRASVSGTVMSGGLTAPAASAQGSEFLIRLVSHDGSSYVADTAKIELVNDPNGSAMNTSDHSTSMLFATTVGTSTSERMRIARNGYVGIGTQNPQYPLSVNGTIRTKEIIVDTGWSDYVFDRGYHLTPLSEVEQTIKEQKHLPGVPSAKEVAEKGVNVGAMESVLLAKIEELTLHVIEQEKLLHAQETRLTHLEQENAALRSR